MDIKKIIEKLRKSLFLISLASLFWFLLRTGKKPSRALYPCQKAALTQSGIYFLYIFPLIEARRIKHFFKYRFNRKKFIGSLFAVIFIFILIFFISSWANKLSVDKSWKAFEEDKKMTVNSLIPDGIGKGIFYNSLSAMNVSNPHRVVSVHSSDATTWAGSGNAHYYINSAKVDEMVKSGLSSLTGKTDYVEAWKDVIPYKTGEVVAIKLNCNNYCTVSSDAMNPYAELVNSVIAGLKGIGVPSNKIWLVDPSRSIDSSWRARITDSNVLFNPNQSMYVSASSPYASTVTFTSEGPTKILPGESLAEANHIINMPQLKGHWAASITLSIKNNYGSAEIGTQGRDYWHKYFYLGDAQYGKSGTNPLIAINMNPVFVNKTRLIIGDGLFGNPTINYVAPVLFQSFGNKPPEILFFGVDPVATDSVMFDYLQRECKAKGVAARNDDQLYNAATAGLGIHEHWNGDTTRKYSSIEYIETDLDFPVNCSGSCLPYQCSNYTSCSSSAGSCTSGYCCQGTCAVPQCTSCSQCGSIIPFTCSYNSCNQCSGNCYYNGSKCFDCSSNPPKNCSDYSIEECAVDSCNIEPCSWSINKCVNLFKQVKEGNSVNLTIEGINCSEKSINLQYLEIDLQGSNDTINNPGAYNLPLSVLFSGNKTKILWTAVWFNDSDEANNDPEIMFNASCGNSSVVSDIIRINRSEWFPSLSPWINIWNWIKGFFT